MSKHSSIQNKGHVGRRGAIVLPAATRHRYGLTDGSLFISEEREDGILIRPASAVPSDLDDARRKIQAGLDALKRGERVSGPQAYAKLKRMSAVFRARKNG